MASRAGPACTNTKQQQDGKSSNCQGPCDINVSTFPVDTLVAKRQSEQQASRRPVVPTVLYGVCGKAADDLGIYVPGLLGPGRRWVIKLNTLGAWVRAGPLAHHPRGKGVKVGGKEPRKGRTLEESQARAVFLAHSILFLLPYLGTQVLSHPQRARLGWCVYLSLSWAMGVAMLQVAIARYLGKYIPTYYAAAYTQVLYVFVSTTL